MMLSSHRSTDKVVTHTLTLHLISTSIITLQLLLVDYLKRRKGARTLDLPFTKQEGVESSPYFLHPLLPSTFCTGYAGLSASTITKTMSNQKIKKAGGAVSGSNEI